MKDTRLIYQNIKTVSLWYFVAIGSAHFLSGLLVANQVAIKSMWLTNRLLDIPFYIVSYLYFTALFKLRLNPHGHKFNAWDFVIIFFGAASLITLQIYDLLFTNVLP